MSNPNVTSYYTLALFCHHGRYSIHGLWPEWRAPHWPESCHPELHFEMSKLLSIQDRLKEHWYSDSSGTNEHFWRHEYEKHGTCSKLTELEYFSKALELFDAAMKRDTVWLNKWKHGKQLQIPVNLDFKFMEKLHL